MDVFPPPEQPLNPFPFYAQMRKFHPIVYDDKNQLWGIFRYNDIQTILTDYRHFSSDVQKLVGMQQDERQREKQGQGQEQLQHHQQQQQQERESKQTIRRSLLTSDPPDHSQLRSVISSAFTPNTIFKLRPRIEEISNDMIDKVIEQGHMDLINDLAHPLPVTVIAELLGVPVQDQNTFKSWADELLGATRGSSNNLPTNRNSEQIFKRVQSEMDSYFINIIKKRRRNAISRKDLVSNLLRAEIEEHKLAEEDILAFCSLLLLAGHVTTVNLIGNAVRSLLDYPHQLGQLLLLQNNSNNNNNKNSNDGRGYHHNHPTISSAIEETLRYRSPVQAVFRFAIQDVVIGGQRIQRGQRMIMWIGSANRDESIFPDAERFDIARTFGNNTHLAFGHGIHFCLGSTLAGLEAQVVLRTILARLKDLRFADEYKEESLKPLHGIFFHGVRHLPLCFKPASPTRRKSNSLLKDM
jgi:cytochrome P450